MPLIGTAKLDKALSDISDKMSGELQVGFMSGASYPDGTNVPTVAFFNEFGTSKSPPRPFFRGMIERESPTWTDAVAKLAQGVDSGEQILNMMGEVIKGQLTKSINDFSSPGLAQSTKDRKGFPKPLIETTRMLNSITYKVEK